MNIPYSLKPSQEKTPVKRQFEKNAEFPSL
jgi:hypothetical protein